MIDVATIVQATLSKTRLQLPEITAETSFQRDLRCDAVDMVCIEVAVGDDCGVDLPACEFENCGTVGDLATLVDRLKGCAA